MTDDTAGKESMDQGDNEGRTKAMTLPSGTGSVCGQYNPAHKARLMLMFVQLIKLKAQDRSFVSPASPALPHLPRVNVSPSSGW